MMANTLSTKGLSTEAEKLSEQETVSTTLDALWIKYLSLLDQYQQLRKSLNNNFSSVSESQIPYSSMVSEQ